MAAVQKQRDAAEAFGLRENEVSLLVNNRSKANEHLRVFEARRVAASSAPEPTPPPMIGVPATGAAVTRFSVGDLVEAAPRTHPCTSLIGTTKEVPVHPNTWF